MPPSPIPEPQSSTPHRTSASFVVGADVLVRRYGDVVLACSSSVGTFVAPTVVRISGTALVVWDALAAEPDLELLGRRIAQRYTIDETVAAADVRAVVADWCAAGIVEVIDPSEAPKP